jgi:hypothetical protein
MTVAVPEQESFLEAVPFVAVNPEFLVNVVYPDNRHQKFLSLLWFWKKVSGVRRNPAGGLGRQMFL